MSHGFNIKKIFIFTTLCICFSTSFNFINANPDEREIEETEEAQPEEALIENMKAKSHLFIKEILKTDQTILSENKPGILRKLIETASHTGATLTTGLTYMGILAHYLYQPADNECTARIWNFLSWRMLFQMNTIVKQAVESCSYANSVANTILLTTPAVLIFSGIIYKLIYKKLIVDRFFRKDITYQSVLNEYVKNWNAFKNVTPEELHEDFDSLYTNYEENGKILKISESAAKDIVINILRKCRETREEEILEVAAS